MAALVCLLVAFLVSSALLVEAYATSGLEESRTERGEWLKGLAADSRAEYEEVVATLFDWAHLVDAESLPVSPIERPSVAAQGGGRTLVLDSAKGGVVYVLNADDDWDHLTLRQADLPAATVPVNSTLCSLENGEGTILIGDTGAYKVECRELSANKRAACEYKQLVSSSKLKDWGLASGGRELVCSAVEGKDGMIEMLLGESEVGLFAMQVDGIAPKDGAELISRVVGVPDAYLVTLTRRGDGSLAGAASATVGTVHVARGRPSGTVLNMTWDWREWATDEENATGGAVDAPPRSMVFASTTLPIGRRNLLWPVADPPTQSLVEKRDVLYIGGDYGVQALDLDSGYLYSIQDIPYRQVNDIAHDKNSDHLWIGGAQNVARAITCPSADECGGAECIKGRQWKAFGGGRWMLRSASPDNEHYNPNAIHVVAVLRRETEESCGSLGKLGDPAVVVSNQGIVKLTPQCYTLRKKMDEMTANLEELHIDDLYGASLSRSITYGDRWNKKETYYHHPTDNDGLWSGIVGAAMAFREAVTKDNRNSLVSRLEKGFHMLSSVAGVPHVFARSYKEYSFIKDHMPEAICPPGDLSNVEHCYMNSTAYPGLMWNRDCSSDEVVGHVFFHAVVSGLLPNTDNASKSKALLEDLVGGIVKHNFTLYGENGKPTTWGRWDPVSLLKMRSFSDNRGLNALQILSHLRAAEYLLGDSKYTNAIEYLKDAEGYNKLLKNQKITALDDWNFSDDQLAILPYYIHLSLTESGAADPDVVCSLIRTWEEGLSERHEALYTIIYTSAMLTVPRALWAQCMKKMHGAGGSEGEIRSSVEYHTCDIVRSLRGLQLDYSDYSVNNTERADYVQHTGIPRLSRDRGSGWVPIRMLPLPGSMPPQWDGNSSVEGSTHNEVDPGMYLLTYWMSMYHGLLV